MLLKNAEVGLYAGSRVVVVHDSEADFFDARRILLDHGREDLGHLLRWVTVGSAPQRTQHDRVVSAASMKQ